MIWSKTLHDGTVVRVEKAFSHRPASRRNQATGPSERWYSVAATLPDGKRRGVCQLGPDGRVRRWYESAWIKDKNVRREVLHALQGVEDLLLVEQVLET